jgi:2-oxoglutarate ferredoxin oxidoreductase subunit alpha
MTTKDLTLAMVGSGGDGVVTMGDLIAAAGAKEGLYVIKTEAYGPQIRGGESTCTVRLSVDEIYATSDTVDALIVFNWADIQRFRGEVVPSPNALILYEEKDPIPLEEMKKGMPEGATWIPVGFNRIAKEATGGGPGKNIVTLGLLSEMFGLPTAALRRALEFRFKKKGQAVIEANIKAFDAGASQVGNLPGAEKAAKFEHKSGEPRMLISGNESAALGAVHAGCRFFAGYPITPSSEILHFMAEWLPRIGGTCIQTEDELAAFGAVVGGSFAGVKSMTATSGPGVSLMLEMIGLATIAEIPSVIVNVQRGGPSTGIPTKSEQSDLAQAIHGTHGDAPKVVLAATDVADCFHATVEAFNIAEEFQIPVILLSDQAISGRKETLSIGALEHAVVDRKTPTEAELEHYERYRITPDGVSPMSFPGMKSGIYQTNGLEHKPDGGPDSGFLMHEKMNEKRYRKLAPIAEKYAHFQRYGAEKPDLGILCWGSSKGPVVEAIRRAEARGRKVATFIPRLIHPFPEKQLVAFLEGVPEVLVVEINFEGQFAQHLRSLGRLPEKARLLHRSGGKNLTVAEIEEQIEAALGRAGSEVK